MFDPCITHQYKPLQASVCKGFFMVHALLREKARHWPLQSHVCAYSSPERIGGPVSRR